METSKSTIYDLYNASKIQQERNKFKPIIYQARKCGQSEIMRQMININLAQGKNVTVISNEGTPMHITGTRRFQASVLPQRATIKITRTPKDHMDDIVKEYNRRPTIRIRLKRKVGVIKMKNGSTIWCATDSSEYKHVTGHSTKLLYTDYSPWTQNNDMNANDIADIGNIRLNNSDELKWREWKPTRPRINIRSKKLELPKGDVVNSWDIEDAPMDIISSANRAYALESLRDESRNILDECTGSDDYYDYDEDSKISFGSNLAGSIPTSNLMIDTDGISTWLSKPLLVESKRPCINFKIKERDVLTHEGLLRAQAILHDEGYD